SAESMQRGGHGAQRFDQPPSITTAVPETNADSSLARYNTRLATSSADPNRPVGCLARKARRAVSASPCDAILACKLGVSIVPGHTAFARMPREPKSAAIDFVKPMTAAFDIPYAKRFGAAMTLEATE